MKTKLLIFSVFLFVFFSCKKDDLDFNRPDQKMEKLKTEYEKQLISAKNGWIAYLFPKGGGGYTFKFNFNENNRVKSGFSVFEDYAKNLIESSYRISVDQLISLNFDTYSYIHYLADPDPYINGGNPGEGLISDFEFSFIRVTTDTIFLRGNHNESDMMLIRAKDNQSEKFLLDVYNNQLKVDAFNTMKGYYNKLTVNGQTHTIAINTSTNTVGFYYEEDGVLKHHNSYFVFTDKGILLKDPLKTKNLSISEISEIVPKPLENKISLKINLKDTYIVENGNKPIFIDNDAPKRMVLANRRYFSGTGFTLNGKIDAFGIRNFTQFSALLFIPRLYLDPLDAFYFVYDNSSFFLGPIFNSIYSNDGKLKFKIYYLLNGINPDEKSETIARNTAIQWFEKEGYYVFQIGPGSYDLVSVKDGTSWIRFT
ncbi:DUF4302 domain-containing protein [Sphingobacterium sp. WM]|uniref:DUF4302 domain-containing protein n=1 Tax=Sphingobacterium sp. WM TaxID=3031802 RepID=UPI00240DB011|nr:DUF4302 domain-containing protein [Sphingobacterium sp. WM]WFB65113.1 DUF4302 domain-containing protein [Sphingobacterium sp. WM]